MFNISTSQAADELLDALGDQLEQMRARYELVVVGGSALLALGLVSRATRDVDLVALRDGDGLMPAAPLPGPFYATVDQGPGKHESDLRALAPTPEELLAAARWTRTHDPSEGYRTVLEQVLAAFGVEDASPGA